MRSGRRLSFSLFLVLGTATLTAVAADGEQSDEELRALRSRIEGLQSQVETTRGERDAAREALRPIELRISRQVRALNKTKTELKTANRQLARLRSDRAVTRNKLASQRTELEAHARSAYALGRQDYMKLLLNQQEPAAFSRMMTYYRYFTEARAQRIHSLQRDLAQLTEIESSIASRTRALTAIEARHADEAADLEQSRKARATVLASLNRELRSHQDELAKLKRDERRLENLLVGLPAVELPFHSGGKFQSQRGRLPLPVSGRITAKFGARRQQGDLRWKGIFLTTSSGREVRAVFDGRVVFADWLSGYGLLLILEHGDGYMTLYGNNESLYSRVGDRIEAGQVIAMTGNTGNIARTGLYFEVRYQGQPHDPLRWCRRG
jgi:septal ring factor EnvC (AmiA/AmiB activator)